MKKAIIILYMLVFSMQVYPYTWTIWNKTGKNVKVKVSTTPGVHNHQTHEIPHNKSSKFAFKKWYNVGLCLEKIEVDGHKINLKNIQKDALESANMASKIDEGDEEGIVLDIAVLGTSIEVMLDMCRSKTLYLFKVKHKDGKKETLGVSTKK